MFLFSLASDDLAPKKFQSAPTSFRRKKTPESQAVLMPSNPGPSMPHQFTVPKTTDDEMEGPSSISIHHPGHPIPFHVLTLTPMLYSDNTSPSLQLEKP